MKGVKATPPEPTTTPEERFARMMAIPPSDHTLDLEVANTYGVEVNGGNRTLSEEGMAMLSEQMTQWVGSRIMHRLNAGRSASRVKVTIKVDVSG
jgi:hypothetical protein